MQLEELKDIIASAGMGTWRIELIEGQEPRMLADDKMKELLGLTGSASTPEATYIDWFSRIKPEAVASVLASVDKMEQGFMDENTYLWLHPTKGERYVRCGGTATKVPGGFVLRGYHYDVDNLVREEAEKEKMSRQQKEQLEKFQREHQEDAIQKMLDIIIKEEGHNLVATLMETAAVYYQADRCYVFEEDSTGQYMVNVYEWCAEGITPEKDNLQEVPMKVIEPWIAEFNKRGSFYLNCDDEYAKQEPLVYEILEPQNVHSLIAAPMMELGRKIGFVGVDNPKVNTEHKLYLSIMATAICHELRSFREHEKELAYQADLEKARNDAEAASQAKTRFLFNMSHDIRTPMNAIVGFTDLLQKHLDDQKAAASYISKIKDSNDFLLSLVNNVLEMARIESGKVTIDEVYSDSQALNDACVSVFEAQMQEKGIDFKATFNVEHPAVFCDETKTREIYLNIISNALKYTPAGGSVTVDTYELPSEREGYVLYRSVIKDTGIGMSKEFLPHLFEEFTREHNSTESRVIGTGLGMPIVKRLVDIMHGTIDVKSELGKGTTFIVTLPHRIAEQQEPAAVSEENQEISNIDIQGKRILLAEDNELNAEIAIELLQEYGLLVEHAEDGVVCVDMLTKAEPAYYDLILMDIQMPNMDGYKATGIIRQLEDKSKANIPIIAMTANAFEEDRRNALAACMNAHVAKPFNANELLRTMKKYM